MWSRAWLRYLNCLQPLFAEWYSRGVSEHEGRVPRRPGNVYAAHRYIPLVVRFGGAYAHLG